MSNHRDDHISHELLKEILHEQKRMVSEQQATYRAEQVSARFLQQIIHLLTPHFATQLTLRSLTMQQFDPGATGIVLQAAFTPAGSTAPNPGFTVVWSDSNSFATFANDASDATGLTQDVTLSTSATVGTSGVITATLTGTFPDGTAASLTGTFNYTIGAAPVGNATGLGITQIA